MYVCRRKALRLAFLPENRLQMPSLPGCRRASGLQRGPPGGGVWAVSRLKAGRLARRSGLFRNALRPSRLRGVACVAKWFYICGGPAAAGLAPARRPFHLQTYLFFPRLETFLPPKSVHEALNAARMPPASPRLPLYLAQNGKNTALCFVFFAICVTFVEATPRGHRGGTAARHNTQRL